MHLHIAPGLKAICIGAESVLQNCVIGDVLICIATVRRTKHSFDYLFNVVINQRNEMKYMLTVVIIFNLFI